jgi:hypothetical protein
LWNFWYILVFLVSHQSPAKLNLFKATTLYPAGIRSHDQLLPFSSVEGGCNTTTYVDYAAWAWKEENIGCFFCFLSFYFLPTFFITRPYKVYLNFWYGNIWIKIESASTKTNHFYNSSIIQINWEFN